MLSSPAGAVLEEVAGRLLLDALCTAAEAAGVQPHEVLHIGDDAHADAWGALRAGMQVAWLNREGHEWRYGDTRPHLEVPDLHALCGCWPDYNTEGR